MPNRKEVSRMSKIDFERAEDCPDECAVVTHPISGGGGPHCKDCPNVGCQCEECQITPHLSDCGVHNEPAEQKGACTCSRRRTMVPV